MSTSNPVETSIRNKLGNNLEAIHLDVINESYMHNVPKGAETHFKVVVVSNKFQGVPLIKVTRDLKLTHEVYSCIRFQRHRLVNDLLKEELNSGVHALSIVAKSPDQWDNSEKIVEPSPKCRGGFGK